MVRMPEEENSHAGKPGEPGKRGTDQRGGEGGVGGAGGEGGTEGGPGGMGGAGGQMGPQGPEGQRGPSNPRALIGYLILAAGVVLAFTLTYQQGQNLERAVAENKEARIALCEIRAGLIRDVARTDALLDDNPGDLFGIPRNLIISGRDDDQDTIDTLSDLDCPQ